MVSSARSSRAVTSMVFAPGCFCTPTITAGLPLRDPSPRLKRRALADIGDVADEDRSRAAQRNDGVADLFRRSVRGRWLRGRTPAPPRCRCPPRCSDSRPRTASSSSVSDTLLARSASGCAITWNWRSAPPIGVTCETPGMASSRRRTVVSAMVRSVSGSSASDEIAKNRISPMIDETGARTGRSTCGGSAPLTSESFSDTSCRAMKMSVPQSNSTHTTAMPTAVADRTRRTPDAPLMALSSGNVTSDSISSGAIPWPSARMVTVGAVRSGNTSTGIWRAVQAPAPNSSNDRPMTSQ